jgi:hypothetical protein
MEGSARMQSNSFFTQWWRLGGACGVLVVVFFVVGAIVQGGEPAMYGDSPDEIRTYWADNGQAYLTGDFIIGLGFVLFFLPFLSALRSLLGAAEGAPQMWSRVIFGGGILVFAMAGAAGSFWTTLAFGDVAAEASDDTLVLLMALDIGAWHFAVAGFAVMTLPAALVIVQTRALPIWLGVLTLIEGVLAIAGTLAILADNPSDSILSFLPFVGALVWILVTSIVLILKKDAPVPAS